MKLAEDVDL